MQSAAGRVRQEGDTGHARPLTLAGSSVKGQPRPGRQPEKQRGVPGHMATSCELNRTGGPASGLTAHGKPRTQLQVQRKAQCTRGAGRGGSGAQGARAGSARAPRWAGSEARPTTALRSAVPSRCRAAKRCRSCFPAEQTPLLGSEFTAGGDTGPRRRLPGVSVAPWLRARVLVRGCRPVLSTVHRSSLKPDDRCHQRVL